MNTMSAPQDPREANNELLRRLLDQPPGEIEAWLARATAPGGFNWLGLAEVAGNNALRQDGGPVAVALSWARIADHATARFIAVAPDAAESRTTGLKRLRAELINRHGSVPGDPFLDCDEIFRWFLGRHGNEFDAAAADATHWTELPIERIRELRSIKNELSVLKLLGRCAPFGTPEVQRWIQLWGRLP